VKKVKNILKLMFFEKSKKELKKGRGRGGG
jgi:hypothetical protein